MVGWHPVSRAICPFSGVGEVPGWSKPASDAMVITMLIDAVLDQG